MHSGTQSYVGASLNIWILTSSSQVSVIIFLYVCNLFHSYHTPRSASPFFEYSTLSGSRTFYWVKFNIKNIPFQLAFSGVMRYLLFGVELTQCNLGKRYAELHGLRWRAQLDKTVWCWTARNYQWNPVLTSRMMHLYGAYWDRNRWNLIIGARSSHLQPLGRDTFQTLLFLGGWYSSTGIKSIIILTGICSCF